MTRYRGDNNIVSFIQEALLKDVSSVYPDVCIEDGDDFMNYLTRVFAGAYITGILPVKKYKTESALNNFWEYTMIQPRKLARYFGFTKDEVIALCDKHGMSYEEMAKWYDGYSIGKEPSMFNPSSVIKALDAEDCDSYWAATGSFDAVARYIQMDFEGLKGDIVKMLGGGRCSVDTTGSQNDPAIIKTKDDVFTVLIHLGYLAYDGKEKKCYVPNMEVAGELRNAIVDNGWQMASMPSMTLRNS